MTLKRLNAGALRGPRNEATAKAKLGRLSGPVGKAPLSFLEEAKDPTEGLDTEGMTPEATINAVMSAVGTGLSQRMKEERERKKAAVAADDYFCIVFQEGAQATAFLKAIGYPNPNAAFVDGTIVAQLLKIELPAPTLKKRKLKKTHDKGLTSLAQTLKKPGQ